jgi:hypothetical protein
MNRSAEVQMGVTAQGEGPMGGNGTAMEWGWGRLSVGKAGRATGSQ